MNRKKVSPLPERFVRVSSGSPLYAMGVTQLKVPASFRKKDGMSSLEDIEAALAQLLSSLEDEQVKIDQTFVDVGRIPFISTVCLGGDGVPRTHRHYLLHPVSLYEEHPIVRSASLCALLTFLVIDLPPNPSVLGFYQASQSAK